MKINKKSNPWKIATIILVIITLVLIIYGQIQNSKNLVVIGNISINKVNLEKLVNVSIPGQIMKICDLDSKECINVQRKNIN